jgi:hypothetical protein
MKNDGSWLFNVQRFNEKYDGAVPFLIIPGPADTLKLIESRPSLCVSNTDTQEGSESNKDIKLEDIRASKEGSESRSGWFDLFKRGK